MNYVVLRDEINTDPLARGYAGMTNLEVATSMNTVDRTRNRTRATGKEVKDQLVTTEFVALTEAQQTLLLTMCNRDDLDPFGLDAAIVADILAATTSLSNLQAWRVESVSRGVELGLGTITEADVYAARSV